MDPKLQVGERAPKWGNLGRHVNRELVTIAWGSGSNVARSSSSRMFAWDVRAIPGPLRLPGCTEHVERWCGFAGCDGTPGDASQNRSVFSWFQERGGSILTVGRRGRVW